MDGNGKIGAVFEDGTGVAFQDGVEDGVGGVAGEGKFAAEHLVEDDAAGPEIGAVVDLLAENLLGRHVADGAYDDAGFGERLGDVWPLGQAEVDDLDLVAGADHQVGRLDVAMDDAVLVGVMQAGEQLGGEVGGSGEIERAAVDSVGQGFAVVVAHDEDDLAVGELFDVMDAADVGVVEDRGGARLLKQTVLLRRVGEHGRSEGLERDEAMEKEVFGLVDDARGTAAEVLEDLVVRDGLAFMHGMVTEPRNGTKLHGPRATLRGWRRPRRWCEMRLAPDTSTGPA